MNYENTIINKVLLRLENRPGAFSFLPTPEHLYFLTGLQEATCPCSDISPRATCYSKTPIKCQLACAFYHLSHACVPFLYRASLQICANRNRRTTAESISSWQHKLSLVHRKLEHITLSHLIYPVNSKNGQTV